VHIDSNDVFWMIPVSEDALEVDFDDARARLRVRGLKVFDDHDIANSLTYGLGLPGDLGFPYPPIPPVPPSHAVVSFDVEWKGPLTSATIHNTSQRFMGSFFETEATIRWTAEQPGFRFQSESPDPTRNLISVLGRERNGAFFA
jgi:hypothetical protein